MEHFSLSVSASCCLQVELSVLCLNLIAHKHWLRQAHWYTQPCVFPPRLNNAATSHWRIISTSPDTIKRVQIKWGKRPDSQTVWQIRAAE